MRALIAAPALLLLIVFALSNTVPTRLGLWPTDLALEAPVSLIVLSAMALAFFTGGAVVWLNELGQRRRARHAENTVKLLEAQVQELKARLPASVVPPPRS